MLVRIPKVMSESAEAIDEASDPGSKSRGYSLQVLHQPVTVNKKDDPPMRRR